MGNVMFTISLGTILSFRDSAHLRLSTSGSLKEEPSHLVLMSSDIRATVTDQYSTPLPRMSHAQGTSV